MYETEPVTLGRVLKIGAVAVLLMTSVLYVIFQARHVIIGPRIVLTSEHSITQNNKQLFLTGSTYNISRLWLNDRPIYTDLKGDFNESLILEDGYTIATLRAQDRYGRTTTVSREYVYIPMSLLPRE